MSAAVNPVIDTKGVRAAWNPWLRVGNPQQVYVSTRASQILRRHKNVTAPGG